MTSTAQTALLAALLLGLVSWMLRVFLVVVVPAERLPARVHDALRYLPPAVLASLVTAQLVGAVREAEAVAAGVMVGGLGVAAVLMRRTGSLALAVGTGACAALVVDLLLT